MLFQLQYVYYWLNIRFTLLLKLTYSRQQYDVEIHHLKIGYQFERKTINKYVDKNRKLFSVLINFATTIFALISLQTTVFLLIRD